MNRTFGNRYQVTEKIGMGGMAEVYKATDATLGRTVALKVMLPQYASDPNFAARFRQEAQAAANLSSPYIVNIYDWGKDADSYYIVMEYVRGTDLKTAIQQRGRIHPRKVAEIGSQVCSALSVAHGYDIIHRDIKSANIMVQADGNVKVMDFGIAQAGKPGMTTDSSVLGTAHYVSPEQAQGKQLAATSDLYSLGVVMYEAATGQLPFDGPDVVSVAMKQVNDMPASPRSINPDIDPRFESIIMRALEKNPEARYRTANEMMRALDDYLKNRPASAETQVIDNAVATPAATTVMPEQTTVIDTSNAATDNREKAADVKKGGNRKRIIIAIVIILLLAGAGIGVAASQGAFSARVIVPNVVDMTQQEAIDELEKYDLTVGNIKLSQSDTVEEGKVMSQDPAANDAVASGSRVNLVVSSGKTASDQVSVPNLSNLTASEAEAQLAQNGLKGNSKSGYSDSVAAGQIYDQDPSPATMVEPGTVVTYYVSSGQETKTSTVPSVIGLSESDARSTLEALGLKVTVEYAKADNVSEGEVSAQSIAADTEVTSGTSITITVSSGSTTETVPDVVGMTRSEARSTLRNAGFKVTVLEAAGAKGVVVSQSPTGSATSGTTITITVGTGTSSTGDPSKPSDSEADSGSNSSSDSESDGS